MERLVQSAQCLVCNAVYPDTEAFYELHICGGSGHKFNEHFPDSRQMTPTRFSPNPSPPTVRKENIQDTLNERGKRYGEFKDQAEIAQRLKDYMHFRPGWKNLECHQAEALDMIQHKIARILNGDPNYDDNWRDIAGYAQLVLNILTHK